MGDPVLEVEGLEQALGGVARGSLEGEGRRDGSSRGTGRWPQLGTDPKPRPGTEVAESLPLPRDCGNSEGEQHSSEHRMQGTLPRGAAPRQTPSPGSSRELGRDSSCEWDGLSC